MRILLILLISIFFLSCNNQSGELKSENEILKKENDSLQKLLTKLNNKYIFDDIKVRVIPSENNTKKIGSEFNGEFVIVGYNKETVVNFSTEKDNNTEDFIDTKSLKRDFGGFPFNLTLKKAENDIYFKFDVNAIHGRDFGGIIIADKIKTE
tara:strand:+ start:748 stop:1203 length:456 start_codon:yes stop_codon:yes gene_type:complete